MRSVAMNSATTRRQWRLDQAADGYARHGAGGIVPWRDQVLEIGLERASRCLRDAGLSVVGYCRGGMFTAPDDAGRRRAIELNRTMIEEAAVLGAPVLVLVCGGLPGGSRDIAGARHMVRDGIAEIMDYAKQADVQLAIEPLHPMYAGDRSCINTLAHAVSLCDELEPSGLGVLGVAVDAYHVWWDPQLADGIRRIGFERLLGFHLCDWRIPTTDLLNDRALMGEGVIDLAGLSEMMEHNGYTGIAEVEIFSDRLWQMDPDELTRLCIERARSLVSPLVAHRESVKGR